MACFVRPPGEPRPSSLARENPPGLPDVGCAVVRASVVVGLIAIIALLLASTPVVDMSVAAVGALAGGAVVGVVTIAVVALFPSAEDVEIAAERVAAVDARIGVVVVPIVALLPRLD